jgi:hypothetical protein
MTRNHDYPNDSQNHFPYQFPQPVAGGEDRDLTVSDAVPLLDHDRRVDVTVWRLVTVQDPSWTVTMPERLAQALVRVYAHPGDLLIDLEDDRAVRDACDNLACHYVAPDWSSGSRAATTVPECLSDAPGLASLILLRWPRPGSHRSDMFHHDLDVVLDVCRGALAPDGCLIVVVGRRRPTTYGPLAARVLAAADRVGLAYVQHLLVTVTADSRRGDRFTYHATQSEIAALLGACGQSHDPGDDLGVEPVNLMVFAVGGGGDG